ncbi:MAG: hypothetical protein M0Q13_08805 [Methanothrix sp.]|jgi:hypothetical protein|nr:hypothetical protein [Methanothrix sp.]
MEKMTITAADTTGIQNYIYGSNLLKHNVGASELVRRATQDWVYDELSGLGNTNVDAEGVIDDEVAIERDDLVSELVYAGGGNTVLIFQSTELAHEFVSGLSRRVLLEAPGLQAIIASREFDWKIEALSLVVKSILEELNRKKRDHVTSSPLLGLCVTADCQYTGLPAVDMDKDGRRISAEVKAKEKIFNDAHDRLTHKLPMQGYEIPKEFDDFGHTKGEFSYIGVIHIDGNEMGKRVAAIADAHPWPEDNRLYIQAIRDFSRSVEYSAQEALKATYQQLISCINRGKISGEIPITDRKIPLRPIVMGGDDITLVCNGRLALTVTEFYLRQIMAKPLKDGKPISARAGVAVVKSHYPFSRAYALSEELVKSSKDYLNERRAPPHNERDLSAIDWHFAVSGAVLNLDQIREREYKSGTGRLTMRPLRLGSDGSDWRSWENFAHIVNDFRTKNEWVERRNKVKKLNEILRNEPNAVEHFLTAYELPALPEVPGYPDSVRTGWIGDDRCTCFDAIEALEFFVPLERILK